MVIHINNESIKCDSYESYEKQIEKLLDLPSAEVWISENGGQDDFPCLSILIDKNKYVVNYFGADDRNFVSAGKADEERAVEFCNGEYTVEGCQVVARETALLSAFHFYKTKDLLRSVTWEEL